MDGVGRSAELARRDSWQSLADEQGGMIAHRQLVELGLTSSCARQWVRSGRWGRVFPGVYVTFTGPIPELSMIWAALLYAGPLSAASHRTALWLAGAIDQPPAVVQLTVPADRRVRAVLGVSIRISRRFDATIHPAAHPPRIRLEDTVLDCADEMSSTDEVLSMVFRVAQRRLTTADRLHHALTLRRRHRHRRLLADVLTEVREGVTSPLERRYQRDVERAHGLPPASRNWPEHDSAGQSVYRDARYEKWRTVVELDGRGAHPGEERFRDLRRDNLVVLAQEAPLRYGWHDVAGRNCAVAAQVAAVLQARGWQGTPRPCGTACQVLALLRSYTDIVKT